MGSALRRDLLAAGTSQKLRSHDERHAFVSLSTEDPPANAFKAIFHLRLM